MLAAARDRLAAVELTAGTPWPATPAPGTPGPGTPGPGTPGPGTHGSGTHEPETQGPGTPGPGTPGLGTPGLGTHGTGTPGPVALAVADATALPLSDEAADLTLAMHMLYHVPDPAQAVRELRRVTKPGGRVVIVLNGNEHLRQLRELVASVQGGGDRAFRPQRERVTLDDGEALARACFSSVTRHDFTAELRLPDPQPAADYVRSMSGTQHGADPERLVAAVAASFRPGPDAVLTITTQTGCLICEP
jgi:hypothetical protein